MKNNKQFKFIGAGVSFALFCLLIVLVKTVDVAAIGPEDTSIGLSHLNAAVHSALGVNSFWYMITEFLCYVAIAIVIEYALIGLFELITRKSFAKVDKYLYCLGGLYAVVFVLYAVFEKVVINYRPIIEEGAEHVEASFPSSHTMLACTVLGSVFLVIRKYGNQVVKKNVNEKLLQVAIAVMCVVTVLGRLLCGVHWFTDIIGGVLISTALLFAFAGVLDITDDLK